MQAAESHSESIKAAGTAAVVLWVYGATQCMFEVAALLADKASGHGGHALRHVLFVLGGAALTASGLRLRRSRSRGVLAIGIALLIADNVLGWWLVPSFSKARAILLPGIVLGWLGLLWRRVGPLRP